MSRMILFTSFTLIISLCACSQTSPSTPNPTLTSGIQGTVSQGPMCPGPIPIGNNPCPDQPFQTSITILDSFGKQVSKLQTDEAGYFKIQLTPGTYILHPEPGSPFPIASDQMVVVTDGQYIPVTIIYDTGIR
jgi:hypothetical protein